MPLLFTRNPPVLDVDTAQTSLLQRIYVDVCEGIFAAHTHTHLLLSSNLAETRV